MILNAEEAGACANAAALVKASKPIARRRFVFSIWIPSGMRLSITIFGEDPGTQ
jgi:hypothetical protein